MDVGVLRDRDLGDMARDLRGDNRGVGADISVVGGDKEASFDIPIVSQMGAVAEAREQNQGQNEAARRPLRRGGLRQRRAGDGGARPDGRRRTFAYTGKRRGERV